VLSAHSVELVFEVTQSLSGLVKILLQVLILVISFLGNHTLALLDVVELTSLSGIHFSE
jgi:hypothetical protein